MPRRPFEHPSFSLSFSWTCSKHGTFSHRRGGTTVSLSLGGELLLNLNLHKSTLWGFHSLLKHLICLQGSFPTAACPTSQVSNLHNNTEHTRLYRLAFPPKIRIVFLEQFVQCAAAYASLHGGSSMWAKLLCGYKQVRGSTPTSPYGLVFKSPTFLNTKSQLKVRKRAMNPSLRHHSERQQKQTVSAAHSCLTW